MVTDIFSSMVFDDATMEARLPKETYKALQRTIKLGKHLGLYIDPSLRYYFDCDQPHNIRAAQPLMLGFEVGLKAYL